MEKTGDIIHTIIDDEETEKEIKNEVISVFIRKEKIIGRHQLSIKKCVKFFFADGGIFSGTITS